MLETMPLPDLPARFAHAATGIRRSWPCAAAAFFARASQVITKPGVGTHVPPSFLPLEFLPGCDAYESCVCASSLARRRVGYVGGPR